MGEKKPSAGRPWRSIHNRGTRPRSEAWYRIENKSDDAVEVLLYDEIGGWWGLTADDFAKDLAAVKAKQITLRINSPGGDVFDGLAIYNSLRLHPADVTCRVEGLAASAASFIAMAGDTIQVCRGSMMMIHDAMGFGIGNDYAAEVVCLRMYSEIAASTRIELRLPQKQ